MSCVDAAEKVSSPNLRKVGKADKTDAKNGNPCIDFQPDESWQIKEDSTAENVPNSKNKDVACSNGRRSLRLRSASAKARESVVANGEAEDSVSENENVNSNSKTAKSESDNDKIKSKRKLKDAAFDSNDSLEEVVDKKAKVDASEDISVAKKADSTVDETLPQNSSEEEKVESPLPLKSSIKGEKPHETSETEALGTKDEIVELSQEEKSKTDQSDMDVDEAQTDMDVDEAQTDKGADEAQTDKDGNEVGTDKDVDEAQTDMVVDAALPDKDVDKVQADKDVDEVQTDKGVDAAQKDKDIDDDIEIINVNDDSKKSDEESDSEIQILDDAENADSIFIIPPPDTSSIEASASTPTNVCLTAGFPYYNSLKEKIKNFKAGEYKPVKFPHTGTLLLAENEVIIESPSLLVPLLIKESDEFPKLEGIIEKKAPEANGNASMMRLNMISKRNFFQSSVGQFLINLGTSRVQEWYHRDMKRAKLKQLKSNKATEEDLESAVALHEKRHKELITTNAVFNFRMLQCKFCGFKSESMCVMEGHYLTPHISPRREYKCNFCQYLTRNPEEILFHFEAMHSKKAILEPEVNFLHECIFCSFQTNLKTKVSVHMNRCRKHFLPNQNLAPPFDFEFPGVTTKPVTIADVVGHKRLLLSSSKNRMPVPEDSSSALARKKLASVLSKLSGPNAYSDPKATTLMSQLMKTQNQMPGLSSSSIHLPPGIVITRPRSSPLQQMSNLRYPPPRGQQPMRGAVPRRGPPFTTNLTSTAANLAQSGISITPITRASLLPRSSPVPGIRNVTLTPIGTASNRTVSPKPGAPQPVALFTNMAGSPGLVGQPQARLPVNVNMRTLRPNAPYQRLNTPPSQVVKGSSGNTFVVCEICDSYIKDLEELRTHMNWVHKVKIHPKMLVSRPPLNCQKCQWRFFTDQGLERHLLGAHGLVTTNMQEMANKNQDGGRCIICGAVFTYKLVSHMTQVHKVTLKPAHLSYKCTVCTATFTLYRLFESHVYNVHSGNAKRPAEETPAEQPAAKKVVEEVGPKRCRGCNVITDNMEQHLIQTHIKGCSVKLCRIEKCKKCLYSSDEMIVIRMSDFGLDSEEDDDSGDDDDGESESSADDEDDDKNSG